jgi:hypothetical protein
MILWGLGWAEGTAFITDETPSSDWQVNTQSLVARVKVEVLLCFSTGPSKQPRGFWSGLEGTSHPSWWATYQGQLNKRLENLKASLSLLHARGRHSVQQWKAGSGNRTLGLSQLWSRFPCWCYCFVWGILSLLQVIILLNVSNVPHKVIEDTFSGLLDQFLEIGTNRPR